MSQPVTAPKPQVAAKPSRFSVPLKYAAPGILAIGAGAYLTGKAVKSARKTRQENLTESPVYFS